jgi:hypothetical protein
MGEWMQQGLAVIALIALVVASWAQIRMEKHTRDSGHSLFSLRGMWAGINSDAFTVQLVAVLILFVSVFLALGIAYW